MALFFTSDSHFNHANILTYCNRPFENVQLMNEALIRNWNSVVTAEDEIWHLGDFALGGDVNAARNILHRLNGKKNFILGNHDNIVRNGFLNLFENRDFLKSNKYFYNLQEIIVPDEEMDIKQKIVLCHFPLESWHHAHHGAWHLHGHCHGTLPSGEHQARLDVGVDVHNYTPISYEDIKKIMTKKVFKPIDHHGRKEM